MTRKREADLIDRLLAVDTQIGEGWNPAYDELFIKALGEIDGKMPHGDGKLHLISAIEALKAGHRSFARGAVHRAVCALDPRYGHVPVEKDIVPTKSTLLSAYKDMVARREAEQGLQARLDRDFAKIEAALIEAMKNGNTEVSVKAESPIMQGSYLIALRSRFPQELPVLMTLSNYDTLRVSVG